MAQLAANNRVDMGNLYSRNPLRKFRWAIEFPDAPQDQQALRWYVRTFARPNLNFAETNLHFRHEQMWIAGKAEWQTVDVTVTDVMDADPMYQWLNTIYELDNDAVDNDSGFITGDSTEAFRMGLDSDPNGALAYKRTVLLTLFDGRGQGVELWGLYHCWPSSVNFGSLDYSSSEACDVSLTLRFDRAKRIERRVTTA